MPVFTFPVSHWAGAQAVRFDGVNDYLTRGADLTGNADGKKGIISFWFRAAALANNPIFFESGLAKPLFAARVLVGGTKVNISAEALDSTIVFRLQTVNTVAVDTWYHVLASWQVDVPGARHLYINDVSDLDVLDFNDKTIDYTRTEHSVGAATNGAVKFNGCLAHVYVNMAEYLDLSVEANLRKFIDANGKPVDLGADGSGPTGTPPIVYLAGDAGGFRFNKGSGGDFAVNGAITDCATEP